MSSELTMIKLVRDNITEQPGIVISHCVNDIVFGTMLRAKIVEESREVCLATTRENLIEELADIAEAIEALMSLTGITSAELMQAKNDKLGVRGGFTKRKIAQIGKVDI